MLQNNDDARGAFARALRRMRVDCRITQSDLAEECGIYRTSLSDYERSKVIPTQDTLNTIIVVLHRHGMNPDDEVLQRAWTRSVKASNNKTIGRVI